METYSLFRQFADSWALLALFAFFIGCIFWAYRPGSRARHDDAAALIFRNDIPACPGTCAGCACKSPREVPHDPA